jgi:TonB-dependent starch-binding outer membrane protein SusC
MEHTRSCTSEAPTFLNWRARLCAALCLTTLVVTTGCSYATTSQPPRLSESLARAADSVMLSTVDLGYAPQSRATITGAVSSLSINDGPRRPYVRSLADLLQGRIAGLSVQPTRGGGISMRVRGGGGEIGAAPLVVIDGDPLPSGSALESLLQSIDPNDVVRVDVLKDVSATAIYGTRGSNGVVLITLRHAAR